MLISLRLKGLKNKDINATCLAPVPHFPRPSQSMYFRDVCETNGREKKNLLGPRDPKRIDRAQ